PDGRVLMAGGGVDTVNGESAASAEIYDPTTGTFSPTGSMSDARDRYSAVALADGRVLVLGGFDEFGRLLASAELYDPNTGRFSPAGAMSTIRSDFCAVLLSDGRVLVVGGYTGTWFLASAEVATP
ncbi:MAG: kelch repeat-containing protein, partial [Candidatus Limnocylindrales bacterium]